MQAHHRPIAMQDMDYSLPSQSNADQYTKAMPPPVRRTVYHNQQLLKPDDKTTLYKMQIEFLRHQRSNMTAYQHENDRSSDEVLDEVSAQVFVDPQWQHILSTWNPEQEDLSSVSVDEFFERSQLENIFSSWNPEQEDLSSFETPRCY